MQLRESGCTDWLWVDAICIDQSNDEERASQVSRMGRIYSSASETVAWLGKDELRVEEVQWGIDVMVPKMLESGPSYWDSQTLTDPELESLLVRKS